MRANGTEWVGGRLSIPAYVMEGDPYRPEMVLWLELPADLIVGSAIRDPKAPPLSFTQTLLDSIERPMVGSPRRPTRVRVADPELAAELRHAKVGVDVVVAPTPELDAVIAQMARSMPRGEVEESYFEFGRVSADALERLFRGAESLYKLAPWKRANIGQALRVDIPQLGVEGAVASIIGALGESVGLLVFPSIDGYESFLRAAERRRPGPPDLGTTVLSLSFERGADLPPAMRREVAKHRWPVADPNAYPRVDHRDRHAMPRPVSERDVRIAAACATSLCSFFVQHQQVFERGRVAPVSTTYTDENGLLVRVTVPSEAHGAFDVDEARSEPTRRFEPKTPRNAPCSCGSGVKYKKCCLPKDEAAATAQPAPIHRSDERLVFAMVELALERFGARWRRSLRDFIDAEQAEQLHLPWSVYCFLVDGRPVVDWFLDELGKQLSGDERGWLASQKRSWLAIWEVIAVDSGRTVTVRDLLSGEDRRVHEVSGSKTLKVRDTILGRVVDHQGASVFAGIHPRPLPPSEADAVVRAARRKLKTKGAVPLEVLRDESVGRHLIKKWERVVEEMDARAAVPPELHNTDGDPFLFTIDHFSFGPAGADAIAPRLSTIEGVEPPDEAEPDGDYTVLKAGNALHKTWENTVVGRIVVERDGLRIETNSIRRADDLRDRLEKKLGDLVRHRVREHTDPFSAVNRRASGKPLESAIPSEEQTRIIAELKRKHYVAWMDQPVPALGGKTPRQAARTKSGREKVDLLLRDIENHEARLADGARFDFEALRRELTIAPR